MDNIYYSRDLYDSIPDYRKIVSIMFLNKIDSDLITECGFVKSDFNRLRLKFEIF